MESSGAGTADETDADLLRRSRDGDRRAFSELWRRHAPTAVAYARSLGAAPPDPEDVVSDAFLSILQLVRTGRGPEERFRPYLLTTVRNTWLTAARRAPSTVPLDAVEEPPSGVGTIDVEAMMNSTALAEAFCALPDRWQHALWLSEVEQLPPREIADVLGMRANAVAALTYRARDGLRKAWIGAHLRRAPAGSDHVRVIELLGAYVQGDLGPRPQKFVAGHLESCADCRAAAGEARHLARAITLGPLLVGGAGLVIVPAYFGAGQAAAAIVAAAAPTAPVLWPVAAAVAVALSVSGSLFLRTPTEPDATAVDLPSVALPDEAASAPPLAPSPDLAQPNPATSSTVGIREIAAPIADATSTPASVPTPVPVPAPDAAPAPVEEPPASPTTAPVTAPVTASSEHDPPPTTSLSRSRWWWVDVAVTPADLIGCPPIATVTIGGVAGTTVLVVIDDQRSGAVVTLDSDGVWTGEIELPMTSGQHAVSIIDTGPRDGDPEVLAQGTVDY